MIKNIGIATLLLSCRSVDGESRTSCHGSKPNVLFIAVDDLRTTIGAYGDTNAVTPNMDALARRGRVFKHAYCQIAVCNPSRASLMTGRRPDTIAVWDLSAHFRDNNPNVVTLPQHFKDNGYHTEMVGKIYHDTPRAQDRVSWSVPEQLFNTRNVRGKYVLKENLDIYQPGGKMGKEKAAATEAADVADNAYIDGQVAEFAVERIRDLAITKEPFFFAVGFRRPHLPFSAPLKYWNMQHVQGIAIPDDSVRSGSKPLIAFHDNNELTGYTDIPETGELTDDQIRNLRHGYYAAVSYVDAQIGKVLDELHRSGLEENTVVCLWSDHGFHLGESSVWGKWTNFELDVRAPLIISAPGMTDPGISTDALVEFIDIYPTLVELCSLLPAEGVEGRSMVPVLDAPSGTFRDFALSQFPRPGPKSFFASTPEYPEPSSNRWRIAFMGYSLRTATHRYTEWIEMSSGKTVEKELYDHRSDPGETVNIAVFAEQSGLMGKLSSQLHDAIGKKRRE